MPIFSGRPLRLRRLLAGPYAFCLLPALAISNAHAEILFSAKVLGPVANIYALDETSGALRRITDNTRWRDLDADVSADGRVVFASNREEKAQIDMQRRAEDFDIYLAGPANSPPQKLFASEDDELLPKFAPGGERIAYIRRSGEGQQLILAALDGSESRVLIAADEIFDFSWSADGRICAAYRRGDQSTLAIAGTAQKQLPAAGADGALIVAARCSPDGKKVAYIRHPLAAGERQLWVQDLQHEHAREQKISAAGQQVQHPPVWSRDSERLLYSALLDYRFFYDEKAQRKVYRGGMQIFLTNLHGGSRQLTSGEALHKSPIFSRDEKQIAFLYADRLDARQLALRVLDINDGSLRELFASVAQRSELRWQ